MISSGMTTQYVEEIRTIQKKGILFETNQDSMEW